MEGSGHHIERMHVWRHTARPSEPFAAALEPFLLPGSERPRFLFRTMSGLAIEAAEQFRPSVAGGIFQARHNFEKTNLNVHISDEIAAAHLGNGALRLFFGLTKRGESRLRKQQEDLERNVPDGRWITIPPKEPFQLYLDISPSVAISDKRLLHAKGIELRQRITSYLTKVEQENVGRKEKYEPNTYMLNFELIPGADEEHAVEDEPFFIADKAS